MFHRVFLYIVAALLGARFRSSESAFLGDDGTNGDFEVPPGVNMGRRRSRAVLYQLSGHYKPEKIKTKLKLNNVRVQGLCNILATLVNCFFYFLFLQELTPFYRRTTA